MRDGLRRLVGFDDQGLVYDAGDHVLRVINPEHQDSIRSLVVEADALELSQLGIVPTQIHQLEPLILEHPKYLITYPHEWPSEMLRRALLFHVSLFSRLQARGLDLKDALPQNVLFVGTTPTFVDFPSLVRGGMLADLPWLVANRHRSEDLRTTIIRIMLVPYFLVPLIIMESGHPRLARSMLSDQVCNVGAKPPSFRQLPPPGARVGAWPRWVRAGVRAAQVSAIERSAPERSYRSIAHLATAIKLPQRSGYSTYYVDKDEELDLSDRSRWRAKQLAIGRALEATRPTRVLDIGCNTGWFSRLACRYGASVVSIDVDEASLNELYLTAARAELPITPLLIEFVDLLSESRLPSTNGQGEVYMSSPASRLASDMVLVLGLLHHLTLGEGHSFESVIATLAHLVIETLAIEFVGLDDPLVIDNPGYFPHLTDWSDFTYSSEAFSRAAAPYFELVSIEESHPATRSILIFRRRATTAQRSA